MEAWQPPYPLPLRPLVPGNCPPCPPTTRSWLARYGAYIYVYRAPYVTTETIADPRLISIGVAGLGFPEPADGDENQYPRKDTKEVLKTNPSTVTRIARTGHVKAIPSSRRDVHRTRKTEETLFAPRRESRPVPRVVAGHARGFRPPDGASVGRPAGADTAESRSSALRRPPCACLRFPRTFRRRATSDSLIIAVCVFRPRVACTVRVGTADTVFGYSFFSALLLLFILFYFSFFFLFFYWFFRRRPFENFQRDIFGLFLHVPPLLRAIDTMKTSTHDHLTALGFPQVPRRFRPIWW